MKHGFTFQNLEVMEVAWEANLSGGTKAMGGVFEALSGGLAGPISCVELLKYHGLNNHISAQSLTSVLISDRSQ